MYRVKSQRYNWQAPASTEYGDLSLRHALVAAEQASDNDLDTAKVVYSDAHTAPVAVYFHGERSTLAYAYAMQHFFDADNLFNDA